MMSIKDTSWQLQRRWYNEHRVIFLGFADALRWRLKSKRQRDYLFTVFADKEIISALFWYESTSDPSQMNKNAELFHAMSSSR